MPKDPALDLLVSDHAKTPHDQAREAEKLLSGKKLTVKCARCEGTGRITIPTRLAETLEVVRKLGPSTSNQIASALETEAEDDETIGHTAVINRLRALMEFELVRRQRLQREGRVYLYEVIA